MCPYTVGGREGEREEGGGETWWVETVKDKRREEGKRRKEGKGKDTHNELIVCTTYLSPTQTTTTLMCIKEGERKEGKKEKVGMVSGENGDSEAKEERERKEKKERQ